MSDLFGSWVPDEWIDQCFAVMALTPQHTHLVLTKHAARMHRWTEVNSTGGHIFHVAQQLDQQKHGADSGAWPLPNVWLGVSNDRAGSGPPGTDRWAHRDPAREAKMTDWQPIATAPKDGSLLLLGYSRQGAVPDVGQWFPCDSYGKDGGWWVSHALHVFPTHWMPLPDPPAAR
jgi:hypothetical protein